jgi:hypothetical protein
MLFVYDNLMTYLRIFNYKVLTIMQIYNKLVKLKQFKKKYVTTANE